MGAYPVPQVEVGRCTSVFHALRRVAARCRIIVARSVEPYVDFVRPVLPNADTYMGLVVGQPTAGYRRGLRSVVLSLDANIQRGAMD